MRRVYLDEAGTTGKQRFAIVAGIIIDVDKHYRKIVELINDVKELHMGSGGINVVFHATDVYNARNDFAILSEKSLDDRIKFIADMCLIAAKLYVPTCLSWVDKSKFPETPKHEINAQAHFFAMGGAIGVCDKYLNSKATAEMATIVAEESHHMREIFQKMINYFKALKEDQPGYIFQRKLTNILIDEGIHYQKKNESPILQIADALAWAFRTYMGHAETRPKLQYALFGENTEDQTQTLLAPPFGARVIDQCENPPVAAPGQASVKASKPPG